MPARQQSEFSLMYDYFFACSSFQAATTSFAAAKLDSQ
jgi:hypothetical protein